MHATPEKGRGKRVVRDMTKHLYGTGRNVTVDNFFTDYGLSQELLENKLTLVGTMRKNKSDIPSVMLPNKARK